MATIATLAVNDAGIIEVKFSDGSTAYIVDGSNQQREQYGVYRATAPAHKVTEADKFAARVLRARTEASDRKIWAAALEYFASKQTEKDAAKLIAFKA